MQPTSRVHQLAVKRLLPKAKLMIRPRKLRIRLTLTRTWLISKKLIKKLPLIKQHPMRRMRLTRLKRPKQSKMLWQLVKIRLKQLTSRVHHSVVKRLPLKVRLMTRPKKSKTRLILIRIWLISRRLTKRWQWIKQSLMPRMRLIKQKQLKQLKML